MENADTKDNLLYKYLVSNENIYLAIYSLESYVFEYDLLSKKDKTIYKRLKDKFDENYIMHTIIPKVRRKINELIYDENAYISVRVYFKPKKYENNEMEFRPIHVTDIISQISIVAMLNVLIYDMLDITDMTKKMTLSLSNLSRLIPDNFYGNRISLKPNELFKPWKQQYQKYTSLTNEYLKKYHTSLEYRYEVTLDLEKFFPSVNPRFIYGYIMEKLPVTLTDCDKNILLIILKKLLYCKIESNMTLELWKIYYQIEKEEEIDYGVYQNFTKGIPQGLPQSYFLGNIAMIPISKKFIEHFPGKSLFYVDDSVIFTKKLKEESFEEKLKTLNEDISHMITDILNKNSLYISSPCKELESRYCVKVHEKGKSYYTRLDEADEAEIFLMCISREASHTTADIFRLYSEEEDNTLKARMEILTKQIEKKIKELVEKQKELERNIETENNYDNQKRGGKISKIYR